jgi:peroxiredoxin
MYTHIYILTHTQTLLLSSLHKGLDLVIIYADPRRMTDEFKIILNQFNRLPLISLKVASCAINCDDINDHRKYVKKNKLSCVLLSDPSRKV